MVKEVTLYAPEKYSKTLEETMKKFLPSLDLPAATLATPAGSVQRSRRPAGTVALALATMLLGFSFTEITAQAKPVPGDLIRIHRNSPDTVLDVRLVDIDEEGLTYRALDGSEVRVSRESVNAVEVGRSHSRWQDGLGLGMMGGALVVGLVANANYTPCDGCIPDVGSRDEATLIGAVAGALGGGLIGALIGSAVQTTSWEPTVGPWSAGSNGFALGMRLKVGHGSLAERRSRQGR